jgi:hypothetical protein
MRAPPGRNCPISYRYGARSLAGPAALAAETLWVAGGLYGNCEALDRIFELYAEEPGDKQLAFNGDFHWFDVAPDDFRCVNEQVLGCVATRGNVETELSRPDAQAGCGCAYPEWVGDATVEHSNRIIERLRATAVRLPQALEALAALPMTLVAQVGGERVAIVHGDADSLAGWAFSQEALTAPESRNAAREAFAQAGVSVFACSHTCLPVLQAFDGRCAILNNGAAGMPNFRGTHYGLASRISVRPGPRALYRTRLGALYLEAVPVDYDQRAWLRRFLDSWPPGSAAHASYYARMVEGPRYETAAALRAEPPQEGREAA